LNQPRRDSGIPYESASRAFGISSFRFEETAKDFALIDHLQIFAELLHGLDPELPFLVSLATQKNARKRL
jgi:hypothetical protein